MKPKFIAKRSVVLLLAVVLLTGCLIPHAANNETAHEAGGIPDPLISTTSNIDALPELSTDSTLLSDPESLAEAEAAYRERMQRERAEGILADSKIADYVNTDEFFETKPMFRLTALETLNSYVVQNADNTNTIYFMSENVKYVDAKGEIREKDVRLSATEKGFAVTDSDVKLLLPAKISDGISVNTGFGSITLTPRSRGDNVAKLDEKTNSVRYDGAFGNGTFLLYTPTLSGVKEDIVLEVNPESNSFEFILEADGLTLYTEDGIYYLVSPENKDCRIRFDQIFIYDANGHFTSGKITISEEGSGTFALTITAPREFLNDAETSYPVTIDPTINISTNTSSANIIDAPVFKLQANLNAGTWSYDSIGYTDSTYGLARTVVKLSGLLNDSGYQSLTADRITNVTFRAKEATGNSSKTVKIHPITGTPSWTETSVTWNNYGSYDSTVNYGGTLTGDQWTYFNITNLVKAWKNGSYNGNGCFIFIMGGTENSSSRALYSTEYSGTGNRPYLSMTYEAVVTFDAYSVYVNEGSSVFLECSVNPEDTYIYNWNISNTNIASCTTLNYDITNIAGYHAGNTNVTVTVRDLSNNLVGSASAMVFVLIPDDIYEIGNVQYNGSVRLTTEKKLSDELSIFACSINYLSNNFPVTDQITQMWRVKHVVYNMYSIRPYYKLDMRLGEGNNSAAVAHDIGMDDTYSLQSSAYLWWITWDTSEKYKIRRDGTSKVLCAGDLQGQTANVSVLTDNNSNDSGRWSFEKITSAAPTGIYLYDRETDEIITEMMIKYIAPDETISSADIGVLPVAYSSTVIDQSFYWYSSNNSTIQLLPDGTVTGKKSSDYYQNVYVIWNYPGMTSVSANYKIQVLKVRNGLYTIQNRGTTDYLKALTADIGLPGVIDSPYQYDNSYQWTITRAYKQYYSIISSKTGLALSLIDDSLFSLESDIVQSEYSKSAWQLWSLDLSPSNNIVIKSQNADLYNSNYVAGIVLIVGGISATQLEYTNNANYKDEWILNPAALQYWYSDEDSVLFWKKVPRIAYDNRSLSNLFYYDSSIEWALSEWEGKLNTYLPSTSVSSADIVVIGDTRYNLRYLNIPSNCAGMTRYDDFGITGYTRESGNGSVVEIIELKAATIFLIDEGHLENDQMCITTHEFGHALGFYGHANGSHIDVMYASINGVTELSFRDYYQILQIWNCMTH